MIAVTERTRKTPLGLKAEVDAAGYCKKVTRKLELTRIQFGNFDIVIILQLLTF